MSRALVLLSGGIDSAAALAWTRQNYPEVVALTFQYHLRPFRERLAVYRLLQVFHAPLIEVPTNFLREVADLPESLNTIVPEGYIPNRNMIFYSIACNYAETRACETIVGGHIGNDSEAFPDASKHFFHQLAELTNQALLTRKIKIELPLEKMTKAEVMKNAQAWGVPFESTWSCYWDGSHPCGKCISCIERAEGFAAIGIHDPLL
ncbi:7-cyano-7-deazaguanine synthase [bacterium]|nr:7-cyano-7-deazaguanine synthase [bacterium]